MKIAWVQLNSLPEEQAPLSELLNLIRSKTSSCREVFLFFTQFKSKEEVMKIKEQIANLPSNTHVLFPVCSDGDNNKESIDLLCNEYSNGKCYNEGTINQIAAKTTEWLRDWDGDYAAKLSSVQRSFHFYSSEDFCNNEGSLFALHINTSVSTPQIGGKSLLDPKGIGKGFTDTKLNSKLTDSKIAIAFGVKGSSLWIDQERDQLINHITYSGKINLYLCSGDTTRVIQHQSRFLVEGKFTEIQLDSYSCVIGYVDLTCNTGSATHYTCDSDTFEWERDNNFAGKASVAGITDAVVFPALNLPQIQESMRAEITSFATDIINISPPAFRVIDWEVDSSQANDIYLKYLADAFFAEISQNINGQEYCIYYRVSGEEIQEFQIKECNPHDSVRIFIFQNTIGATKILSPHDVLYTVLGQNRVSDKTAIIILRALKRGDKTLPKTMPDLETTGGKVSVEYKSIAFAWLDYTTLVLSMICEKYANPEKQKESLFAISYDKNKATQKISPTKESGRKTILDISEKLERIDSTNQSDHRSDDAEKGDDRDGR